VQCHIAYPERGSNPIHRALPALAALAGAEWDAGDEHFPPTSFQISNVHAGAGASNIIPDALQLLFNFRFSPASTVEGLEARVHAMLDSRGLEYELAWTVSSLPFITPAGPLVDSLRAAVADATGVTPVLSTSGGTSDGRFLVSVAREVVEFGPLAESMHGVNERMRLSDIAPLSVIYEETILRLLAGGQ
jgi:succinyl-diaminopimelate desuccinylase